LEYFEGFALLRGNLVGSSLEATLERTKMKKLIAMMGLVSLFAVGCAHNRENQGGTSEGNYSTSDTSTGEKGKMQDNNANQPSSSTTSTNSNSSAQPQQP
jgi:hypothetical protein